jgi:hypothetical protein
MTGTHSEQISPELFFVLNTELTNLATARLEAYSVELTPQEDGTFTRELESPIEGVQSTLLESTDTHGTRSFTFKRQFESIELNETAVETTNWEEFSPTLNISYDTETQNLFGIASDEPPYVETFWNIAENFPKPASLQEKTKGPIKRWLGRLGLIKS